jgi:hypothetical protein
VGISAVQDMCVRQFVCVCSRASGTLVRRLERGSHLQHPVRGCRCMMGQPPKRCDGISDVAYRILTVQVSALFLSRRAEPVYSRCWFGASLGKWLLRTDICVVECL